MRYIVNKKNISEVKDSLGSMLHNGGRTYPMKEIRVPTDVIEAIFHFLGQGFRFSADAPKIHRIFYKLSEERQYAAFFNEFVFDNSQMYPYCATVRHALDNLQQARLLACINPGLDDFEITEVLAKLDIDRAGLFSSVELELLKQAANKFKSLLATTYAYQ